MRQKGALLAFVPLVISLIVLKLVDDEWKLKVVFLGFVSQLTFFATLTFIPVVKDLNLKADLFGRDINKDPKTDGSTKIPESLGIVCGSLWLTAIILFDHFFSSEHLGEWHAALTSVSMMIFLGFADDVLDLRWAIKIFFSLWASLPLLVSYSGPTTIIVPKPARVFLPTELNLGYLYHFYMAMVTAFCTNSINIYAGINGLEAGQSLVISLAILLHNVLQLDGPYRDDHIFSIFLMLPFTSTVLGLLVFNWYPSKVFVGDSFTYFAGMTFAVCGILGHFSKTLMLFFIPQLLNFLVSIPQLANTKWLPCPRHRLPKRNPDTGLLHGVKANWNLLNIALHLLGPTSERNLCVYMLLFQAICCLGGLVVRYSTNFTKTYYDNIY